jgi:hypothetical protein
VPSTARHKIVHIVICKYSASRRRRAIPARYLIGRLPFPDKPLCHIPHDGRYRPTTTFTVAHKVIAITDTPLATEATAAGTAQWDAADPRRTKTYFSNNINMLNNASGTGATSFMLNSEYINNKYASRRDIGISIALFEFGSQCLSL